ncbi:MAG: DNA translocase FtsK 4TM domain-containing protein [Pirellulaceae bacterium]|nr:DNA translocase FtsK 4TM domain-containing protein [Pirellulaceae bacterium]
MLQNRRLVSDLFALTLLGLVVFLASSLATYDPADPLVEAPPPLSRFYRPDVIVYPTSEHVGNACGRWGAVVADGLLTGLGIGAFYLVLSLAVLDFLLLRRHPIDTPLIRGVGWIATLIGITTIAAIVFPAASVGPVIGSGGYLGALGNGLLQMHFATAGSLILALSLVAGGLLLCTDYVLLRMVLALVAYTLIVVGKTLNWSPRKASMRKAGKRAAAADEDDDLDDDGPVTIKFSGRTTNMPAQRPADDLEAYDEPAEAVEPDSSKIAKGKRRGAKTETESESEAAEGPRIRRRSDEAARQEVMLRLDEASRTEETVHYELPTLDLLLPSESFEYDEQEREVRRKAKILEKTFADFGFKVRVVEIETGPVIAQYEVELEAGLRLSKITGLAEDLAIALRVPSVRIVAPIPGKNTVGIEVPNEQRQVVRLREVMEESNAKVRKMRIPLFLGKDVSGKPLVVDLSTLPHLLIAGRTGTGKSVCLNAIIASMLMTRRPDEVRMLMIDPKMVELSGYGRLPHLMHPVVTDMRKAEAILAWAVEKMEERYSLLARAGVRHISSYNQLDEDELMNRLQPETEEERASIPLHLPFIVIVADEMADLMMTAGKEVEQHIIRLAQKSRAVGIHLILATQKPTVDVITGLIKSNLPARIAFQVASRTDSRVVLDEMGADKLLGNGDMLFLWPGTSTLLRGQGTYLEDDEIEKVVEFASQGEQNFVHELVNIKLEEPGAEPLGDLKQRDDMYEAAVDVVVREGRGSVSLLQRALGIGYGRAARLIDFMAEDGIVGAYAGSQAREVLISLEDWQRKQSGGATASEPGSRRSNKLSLRNQPLADLDPDDYEDGDSPPFRDDENTTRPLFVAGRK